MTTSSPIPRPTPAGADRNVPVAGRAEARHTAQTTPRHRSRGGRGCGRGRSARGTGTPCRRSWPPLRTCAASPPHRRRSPATRPRHRGCRAARRARCRCGSGRRSPSGSRSRRSARPSGCVYCPVEKNDSVAPSPRIWSIALCTYARYWISGIGSRPDTPAPRARPRIVCSSSNVSNTRRPPADRCSPRVTPYTPPLAPTSSPNTSTGSSTPAALRGRG